MRPEGLITSGLPQVPVSGELVALMDNLGDKNYVRVGHFGL